MTDFVTDLSARFIFLVLVVFRWWQLMLPNYFELKNDQKFHGCLKCLFFFVFSLKGIGMAFVVTWNLLSWHYFDNIYSQSCCLMRVGFLYNMRARLSLSIFVKLYYTRHLWKVADASIIMLCQCTCCYMYLV